MGQKRVTLIVSDLHMGDGAAGDDFVDDKHQFAGFVRAQAETPEGKAGQIELIVNGDFLELVQVLQDAYKGNSHLFWCSEDESVQKLDKVIAGHPAVFEALKEFQALGNQVTVFPGNHDIDLVWPAVQKRLQQVVPGIKIEVDKIDYPRYGNRLQISHGHLFPTVDPANGFKNWQNPILNGANPPRLEMCPGTLFMVKFVNLMEAKYPFADNLSPVTSLAGLLAREDRWGFIAVGWMLSKFAAQYPQIMLSAELEEVPVGAQLLNAIQGDKYLRQAIAKLYADLLDKPGMTQEDVKAALSTEDAVAALLEQLFVADPAMGDWVKVFDGAKSGTLGAGDDSGHTLSIIASGRTDARAGCIEIAESRWKNGAQVVVLGHTHLPQNELGGKPGQHYYNPGSWTRYVEVEDAKRLTLKDLEDESKFPYQLNYVRVEDTGAAVLKSEMVLVEAKP